MSQHTAQARPAWAVRRRRGCRLPTSPATGDRRDRAGPSGGQADDDGVGPDEPDEDEFELIGDNDLGEADLGPAAPDARDPDADSGRIRKITTVERPSAHLVSSAKDRSCLRPTSTRHILSSRT